MKYFFQKIKNNLLKIVGTHFEMLYIKGVILKMFKNKLSIIISIFILLFIIFQIVIINENKSQKIDNKECGIKEEKNFLEENEWQKKSCLSKRISRNVRIYKR